MVKSILYLGKTEFVNHDVSLVSQKKFMKSINPSG